MRFEAGCCFDKDYNRICDVHEGGSAISVGDIVDNVSSEDLLGDGAVSAELELVPEDVVTVASGSDGVLGANGVIDLVSAPLSNGADSDKLPSKSNSKGEVVSSSGGGFRSLYNSVARDLKHVLGINGI